MKFLVRFDDITPGMAWSKFSLVKSELELLGVRSILGVVPENRDAKLCVEAEVHDFYDRIRAFKAYGDTIAQHGTFHTYTTSNSGLLAINSNSEFAGLDFKKQYDLLLVGKKKLLDEGVWEPFFMAPSHAFDDVTIDALLALNFTALTDGYGIYPYRYRNLIFVPQLISRPIFFPIGYLTICVHINSMTPDDIDELMDFVRRYRSYFVDFKDVICLDLKNGIINKSFMYLTKGVLRMCRSRLVRGLFVK